MSTYNGPYKGKLTPNDLALIQETSTNKMVSALSTERADRPAAEAAVTALYEANGLKVPAFVWMDSPLGGIYALSVLQTVTKDKTNLRAQLGAQLGGQLGAQLGGQWCDTNQHPFHPSEGAEGFSSQDWALDDAARRVRTAINTALGGER